MESKYSVHETTKDGKEHYVVCNWKGDIVNNVLHKEKWIADNHAMLLNLFVARRQKDDAVRRGDCAGQDPHDTGRDYAEGN